MVAPLVAAAGIGAIGSVLGGAAGGKGAKKAAKIQAQSAREQIAAQNANRDFQYNLNLPTINRAGAADTTIAGLLNIGGDKAASEAALNTFRNSSGYQDLMREGLGAVNANAYARGQGDSGATWKALQDRGSQIANGSLNQYLGHLGGVSALGGQARGLVAGIGTNTVNAMNQTQQNTATAQGNAALFQAGNTSQMIQNLINAGAYAYGSSYQKAA